MLESAEFRPLPVQAATAQAPAQGQPDAAGGPAGNVTPAPDPALAKDGHVASTGQKDAQSLTERRGAEPPRVFRRAIECAARFVVFPLPRAGPCCCPFEQRVLLCIVHRLQSISSVDGLFDDAHSVATRDHDRSGQTHRVVQAIDRGEHPLGEGLTLEEDPGAQGFHSEDADLLPDQDGQNFLLKALVVSVHHVQRHLHGVEPEIVR